MTKMGLGVKVATLPVIALGVGIGVDYGIYLYNRLEGYLESGLALRQAYFETMKSTGLAVAFTGITLGAGVCTWVFSQIKFQADMGLLLMFMFLWNMLGAIALVPALARVLGIGTRPTKPIPVAMADEHHHQPFLQSTTKESPLNVIIFGATGATGHHLVERALQAGHHVTAFVRDPSRLPTQHPNLRHVVGDVMDAKAVNAALPGHDAVLCVLGVLSGRKSDAGRAQRKVPVCSQGTRHILDAMAQHGVRRIVVLTASAVGAGRASGRFGAAAIVRMVMRDVMDDKEIQERDVMASATDWTLVRPVKLNHKPLTGHVQSGETLPWSLASGISHADVADFMVRSLSDRGTFRKGLVIKS